MEEACNYDANATLNDGSCDFLTCLVFGCTDDAACNYDANATVDNGTCLELDACGVCGGLGEAFQCGCDNIPEGDCDCDGNQLDALGVCGGIAWPTMTATGCATPTKDAHTTTQPITMGSHRGRWDL